ncbi:MAG: hypothetical protein KGI98_12075 [Euryarchaeota archaeon]|nr:hypothetical protein [Euryarchaeota archaeon]MDE1881207.1 hypothetical protein [Euryarchaeota archaeon]
MIPPPPGEGAGDRVRRAPNVMKQERKVTDKWSQHVHIQVGGLGRWCMACPVEERHRALKEREREVGYSRTVSSLDLLANLNRRRNPYLHRIAREDVGWLEREHERHEHATGAR